MTIPYNHNLFDPTYELWQADGTTPTDWLSPAAWSSAAATTYRIGDSVTNGGKSYRCIEYHTVTQDSAFGDYSTKWVEMPAVSGFGNGPNGAGKYTWLMSSHRMKRCIFAGTVTHVRARINAGPLAEARVTLARSNESVDTNLLPWNDALVDSELQTSLTEKAGQPDGYMADNEVTELKTPLRCQPGDVPVLIWGYSGSTNASLQQYTWDAKAPEWATRTAYKQGNIVLKGSRTAPLNRNLTYICLSDHTSDATDFEADWALGRWEIFTHQFYCSNKSTADYAGGAGYGGAYDSEMNIWVYGDEMDVVIWGDSIASSKSVNSSTGSFIGPMDYVNFYAIVVNDGEDGTISFRNRAFDLANTVARMTGLNVVNMGYGGATAEKWGAVTSGNNLKAQFAPGGMQIAKTGAIYYGIVGLNDVNAFLVAGGKPGTTYDDDTETTKVMFNNHCTYLEAIKADIEALGGKMVLSKILHVGTKQDGTGYSVTVGEGPSTVGADGINATIDAWNTERATWAAAQDPPVEIHEIPWDYSVWDVNPSNGLYGDGGLGLDYVHPLLFGYMWIGLNIGAYILGRSRTAASIDVRTGVPRWTGAVGVDVGTMPMGGPVGDDGT